MASQNFATPPPKTKHSLVSFPAPGVLLITLNRPKDLNCINNEGHWEMDALFNWMDNEPALVAGVITGKGRAFCAGADLKEVNMSNSSGGAPLRNTPASGFGALSRRTGLKPIIAAVNGLAYGGGTEIVANIDMAFASPTATFALPEVKRGLTAMAGALPRIVRNIGKHRAMEMALTGRVVGAKEAESWGLINRVVEGDVVEEAIKVAASIGENSPDAVIISKKGIEMGWEGVGAEDGTRMWQATWGARLAKGENLKEGVRAFVEKRKPKWVPAKL